MIDRLMRPATRRSFALSLLIAPMACFGCGGDGVVVDTGGGDRRRQKAGELQKKADQIRNSGKTNVL
jgi:hypothetical protein